MALPVATLVPPNYLKFAILLKTKWLLPLCDEFLLYVTDTIVIQLSC